MLRITRILFPSFKLIVYFDGYPQNKLCDFLSVFTFDKNQHDFRRDDFFKTCSKIRTYSSRTNVLHEVILRDEVRNFIFAM